MVGSALALLTRTRSGTRSTRGRRGTSTALSWWRRSTSGSGSWSPWPAWTAPCSVVLGDGARRGHGGVRARRRGELHRGRGRRCCCLASWSSAMFGEEQGSDLTNQGRGTVATRWGSGVTTAPVRRGSARDGEAPRARLIRRRRCLGAEEKMEVAAPWGMGQGRARLLLYRGAG